MSKIFAIHADNTAAGKKDLYSEFLPKGFTASRHATFAPHCDTCNACVPLRIRTVDYKFSTNDKSIFRHNNTLGFTYRDRAFPQTLSQEHVDLFRRHALIRHPENAQDQWDDALVRDYLEGHSGLLDVRGPDGTLMAAVVFDYLDKGLAPYYIFFDPKKSDNRSSLGKLCMLKMIEHAQTQNPGPVYLGYWVEGAVKFEYKTRFRNIEALSDSGWQDFDPLKHRTGPDYKKMVPPNADQFHARNP